MRVWFVALLLVYVLGGGGREGPADSGGSSCFRLLFAAVLDLRFIKVTDGLVDGGGGRDLSYGDKRGRGKGRETKVFFKE